MERSRDRLEQALARIADPAGEGARTCLTVYAETARQAADAADARHAAGQALGPLDGRLVTIKDLFDVRGEVTRAGSPALARLSRPAESDAPVVQRLRTAGAVIIAKTNMTEFAYSGVGQNPHFGTPRNPADRTRRHLDRQLLRPVCDHVADARRPGTALRLDAVWPQSRRPGAVRERGSDRSRDR
jgi:aspartyl-tRNA(Asn)/glutamyl-tRNA(Gln) amidotransferase subunit A